MKIKQLHFKAVNGFGMIEILISIVVLALGLLGLAGMQLFGLRNNNFAYQRSQAIILAYDLADRMRTNMVAVENGDYDYSSASEVNGAQAYSTCVTDVGCTTANMAEQDVYDWYEAIQDTLPSGVGLVCLDSTPNVTDTWASPACDGLGDSYAIKIWWDDDRDGTRDAPFILSFQP